MEEEKFRVRCYDKNELAKMYFPKLSDHVSVAKLRRWMRNCTPLMEAVSYTHLDVYKRQPYCVFCI